MFLTRKINWYEILSSENNSVLNAEKFKWSSNNNCNLEIL
jgi:hypothetical protein